MPQVMTNAEEAARLVNSGDMIMLGGQGPLGHPGEVVTALAERFERTGTPRDLTLFTPAGAGCYKPNLLGDRLGKEGLLRRYIAGHFRSTPQINRLLLENKIEGYCIPQGVASQLCRAAAGNKPGIITKVGLRTVEDPRLRGGRMNDVSHETWVELLHLDDEEWLLYRAPRPDVALLRGTTADPKGNITMEKEPGFWENLSMAQAAKARGGKVIVQVERVSGVPAHPQWVKIPGVLVDAIVVAPNQFQTLLEQYNPALSGELRIPDDRVGGLLEEIRRREQAMRPTRVRELASWIVARRAVMAIRPHDVVNLGVGIPELVASILAARGVPNQVCLTVEAGLLGGAPCPGMSFNCAINPDVIYEQSYQFDFYDGGGLDIACLGSLEVDAAGNVNVTRVKDDLHGFGGFANITQAARRLVFCQTFTAGGLTVESGGQGLRIVSEGEIQKFSERVQEISFSGDYASERGQQVLYVTERCVFRLARGGIELVEVAPGIDVEADIIAKLPFKPRVSEQLKTMDESCFRSVDDDVWKGAPAGETRC